MELVNIKAINWEYNRGEFMPVDLLTVMTELQTVIKLFWLINLLSLISAVYIKQIK